MEKCSLTLPALDRRVKDGGRQTAADASDVLERGKILEPLIADMFAANNPQYQVNESGIIENGKYPFLIGSPDRILSLLPSAVCNLPSTSGLEIKTADITKMSQWGEEGTDEIPVEYLVQCQWYCG